MRVVQLSNNANWESLCGTSVTGGTVYTNEGKYITLAKVSA